MRTGGIVRAMDKSRLRQALLASLSADLETQTRAALMSRDEATHEESKPENQYDMHAQEAAYLAEGQARLAKELSDSLAAYHALPLPDFTPDQVIALGAVITLEAGNRTTRYFLGPKNGGLEISLDEQIYLLITPQSPLGRLLVGRKSGEVVALPGRTTPTQHRIVKVE